MYPGQSSDASYAEALVGVDGEWRGINIEAMPREKEVIDHDPTATTPDVHAIIETDDA